MAGINQNIVRMNIVNEAAIEQLIATDGLFAKIYARYGPPPVWARPAGFVSLCRIILEQQVSLASAKAHYLQLKNYLPAFTPAHILLLTDAEMRRCRISRQKATYLKALATAVTNGTLDIAALSQQDEATVRAQLTSIKGIGQWTADIYLMLCLQAKDIFPIGDIAVINTLRELTGAHTKEDMLQLAESWTPRRSLAVYFLWHYYLNKRKKPLDFL
ncbi:DNA-3-methyladenine glycosylase 2 family protein [Phnomibacter ginsenosidimutans]|uniref:DNA-3-methyladenine glycosylase II n=2 Tax=Phnomibacter ginsenosidimutans TaxID=2676868 RepID=A0A6I6GNA6_9BACT|nr:DNA-3-methyladenine glycosylase 2 family protein [Phnomibacter ginsenosidimutans]